jgi:diguanylate cyclase (GGDEF)-like protein
MDDRTRLAQRRRGLLLATGGLLLALGVGLGLNLLGLARFELGIWARSVAATLLLQAGIWLVLELGWDRRLSWDPHFVLLPTLVATALLNSYIYVAPELRFCVLMAWFITPIFLAGLAGFLETMLLGAAMTIGYVATVRLLIERGEPLSMAHELTVAGVFWVITLFAGLVFERLRREHQEMRALRRRLVELALTDPLTGLPNRRQFEQALRTELARTQRGGGVCSLAMIDVDNFKPYNDALGHLAGDAVLSELASLMRAHLRAGDVGCRWGGDEFAAIIHGAGEADAIRIVERLRGIVAAHAFAGQDAVSGGRLTISVGLACAPRDGTDYETLVRHADEALYRAKSSGRNSVWLRDGQVA